MRGVANVCVLGSLFALASASTVSAAGTPDLAVTDVTLSAAYVKQGSTLKVTATVKNVGSADLTETTGVAYWLCQNGELIEPKAPICGLIALTAAGADPKKVGPLKVGESATLVGDFPIAGFVKPAHMTVQLLGKVGDKSNDIKKAAFEMERPNKLLQDLEMVKASVLRDVEASEDVRLQLKVKNNAAEPVEVVALFCRATGCEEKVRTKVTPAWVKQSPGFYTGEATIPFKLSPYFFTPEKAPGDFDVTVTKVNKDADLTNNKERPPAPRLGCPTKYQKKVKKGKKVISVACVPP